MDDIDMYGLCFSDEGEVECPHCDELLALEVSDPEGTYQCRCGECNGAFTVDLAEDTIECIWED